MITKLKILSFFLLWFSVLFIVVLDPSIRNLLFTFLKQHPILAPFVLILIQMVLAIFLFPCSPLTIFAGLLWGFKIGIIYSTIATFLASIATFILGRYVFKNLIHQKITGNLFFKIQKLIEQYHWKASMIAHINPIFPGSSLGYVFGTSQVSLLSFALGAVMGTFPLQLMMVGMGNFAQIVMHPNINFWMCIPIVVTVMGLLAYKKLVARFFRGKKNDVFYK